MKKGWVRFGTMLSPQVLIPTSVPNPERERESRSCGTDQIADEVKVRAFQVHLIEDSENLSDSILINYQNQKWVLDLTWLFSDWRSPRIGERKTRFMSRRSKWHRRQIVSSSNVSSGGYGHIRGFYLILVLPSLRQSTKGKYLMPYKHSQTAKNIRLVFASIT